MPINTIYIIHNKVNDKKYIGQTWTSLTRRWHSGYHNSTHLYRAMQKYGTDSFYYETLALCSDQATADYLEEYYIELFDTCNDARGYNLRIGGENKFQHSPETIKRMSASATQAKVNAEDVIAIRKAFDEGATILELAAQHAISGSSVSDIIYRRTWRHLPGSGANPNRIAKTNRKITPALRERILELYNQGLGYRKLHKLFPELSVSSVRNAVKGFY